MSGERVHSSGPMQRRAQFLTLVVLLLSPRRALPQVAVARIEVVAVDESAGVVPDVIVTLLRSDTGLQRTAITDAVGLARAIALPPGSYDVRLERAGFQTAERVGLTLRVGQTV